MGGQAIRESNFLDILRNNPTVVAMEETVVTQSHLAILMEYCQEGDLGQYIRKYPGSVPNALIHKWVVELVIGVSKPPRPRVAPARALMVE